MGICTLLVGGARSGKSNLAVELGRRFDGPVIFIATAQAGDDDMEARIRHHRVDRPDWPTIEEPVDIAAAVTSAEPGAMLLVDCLTLWVANLLFDGHSSDDIRNRADELGRAFASRPGPSVVITNEVGMGIHPESTLGREYRDILGTVNQIAARHATRTMLLVAGRALELRDPFEIVS